MHDRAIIEEVRQKTDIVALVGTYVALQRRGQKFVGLCPFHHEKTPSFQVSPDQGLFYCFGCQTGGDAFAFVQHIENLTFAEALRVLAERAGVSLAAERDPAAVQRRRAREQVYRALELAAAYYQAQLNEESGAAARAYLAERQFSAETIAAFGLGLAPPGWDNLLQALQRHRISPEVLAQAGLIGRARSGKLYDRFRNRIMFPIWDRQGRVVGFGGRVLAATEQPKYLNSPEGTLFNKGRLLYGAHLARGPIRTAGYTIVVEGYMDAIACHQAGLANTVASMGTALTAEQGQWLRQQAEDVIIAFDADAAGTAATLRGLDLLASLGCRVRIVSLPAGADPDDVLRTGGREQFLELVAAAESLVDYKLRHAHDQVLGGRPPATAEEKARLVQAFMPILAAIPNAVERNEYVHQVAGRFSIRPEVLLEEMQRSQRRQRVEGTRQPRLQPSRNDSGNFGKTRHAALASLLDGRLTRAERVERDLVALLLRRPEWVADVQAQLPVESFRHPELQALARSLYSGNRLQDDWPNERKSLAAALLLHGEGAATMATDDESSRAADRQLMSDCIRFLAEHTMVERMAEVRRLLMEDERSGRPYRPELMKEYAELAKKSRNLSS